MIPRFIAPRVALFPQNASISRTEGCIYLPEPPDERSSRFVFGDGSHPTTRLCAGALDLLCHRDRPEAVLDVGTGTGVLARIARARGATFVVGTDIDPGALEWARRLCSLDEANHNIELSSDLPDAFGPRFDLVVANILQGVLLGLATRIAAALRPGGTLLMSGFTPREVPTLRTAYERQALTFVQEARLDEWSLLRFVR